MQCVNLVKNNKKDGFFGVMGSWNTFEKNTIEGNVENGIYLYSSNENQFMENVITGHNQDVNSAGIYLKGSENCTKRDAFLT